MAKRNKPLITASVSPYIKEQAEALVESRNFGSMSDLVSIALAEFIGKYNREQKEKAASSKESAKNCQPVIVDGIIE